MILPLLASLLLVQTTDTVRISYPDAMELARQSNPRFVRQQLQAKNAELWMASARAARYLPTVNVDVTTPEYVSALTRVTTTEGEVYVPTKRRTLQSGLSVTQPLPTGGVLRVTGSVASLSQPLLLDQRYTGRTFLGFRLDQTLFGVNYSIRNYRLSRESYARSQAEFADQERNLQRNVLGAYFGLVASRKQVQIDSVLFVRDSLRVAGMFTGAAGTDISEVDSLKFELEVSRSAFNRTRSQQALLRAQASLNEVLGYPATTVVMPDSTLSVERQSIDVERGVSAAIDNRWDYVLAVMGVENRKMGLRDAHRTSPVTVSVNSTIGFDGSARSNAATASLRDALEGQNRSQNIVLGVSIPVFDRFEERNAVGRAQNDLRVAESNLAEQRRQLENEVRLAAQRVANASLQLDLAEKQSRITRRTLEIQSSRFARGEITSVELLIDQANQRQAEIGLLQAQVELLTANEEWRRAIGVGRN
ncbi:MAG: TolC family protein [Gemmatimonadaceae bacterium]|nr:TolC family protein [Gemmatimonadaceae bacterium]